MNKIGLFFLKSSKILIMHQATNCGVSNQANSSPYEKKTYRLMILLSFTLKFFYILFLSATGAELKLYLCATIETSSHKILVFIKNTNKILPGLFSSRPM